MLGLQLRPTFEISLSESRSFVIDRLGEASARVGDRKDFAMFGEYGELHVPVAEHRLWSPHLSFYVSDRDQGSIIRGRFAPRLEVWTFVWIVYLAMAFTAFFGLILAYSQWMLGGSASWGIAAAGVASVVILALYIVAGIGQQWSSDQMASLKTRLHQILETAELQTAAPTQAVSHPAGV